MWDKQRTNKNVATCRPSPIFLLGKKIKTKTQDYAYVILLLGWYRKAKKFALSSYGKNIADREDDGERKKKGALRKLRTEKKKQAENIPTRESIGALDLLRIARGGKEIEEKIEESQRKEESLENVTLHVVILPTAP